MSRLQLETAPDASARMLKNTDAAASETLDFDMFATPVTYPERETLRGTGPRGLVRDDRRDPMGENSCLTF